MLTWLVALLIVAAGCLLVAAAGTAAFFWAAGAVRRGGAVGIAGVALTVIAGVNTLVPRTCDTSGALPEHNRPVVSAVAGEGRCHRLGAAQVEVMLLLGVGTSLAAHVVDRRRRAATVMARH